MSDYQVQWNDGTSFLRWKNHAKALAEVAFGKTHQKRAPNFRLLSWFERCFSLDGLFMTIQDDTGKDVGGGNSHEQNTSGVWYILHHQRYVLPSRTPIVLYSIELSLWHHWPVRSWSGFRIHVIVIYNICFSFASLVTLRVSCVLSLASTTENPCVLNHIELGQLVSRYSGRGCSRHFCEQVAIPKNNSR